MQDQERYPQEGRRALTGPAIFLIIVAALGILASGAGLAFSPLALEAAKQDQTMDEQQRKIVEFFYGPGALLLHGWGILASFLALFGGICMLRAKSWGMALTGCIFAALNPSCFCCVLGLGPMIWGLMVLLRPEVKAAFR